MFVAISVWLTILVCWPAPAPPWWIIVLPIASQQGCRASTTSSRVTKDIWDERFKSIRHFERHLARNGVLILKFFLHVSKEEQRKRFLARLEEPAKRWKFDMNDVAERRLWDKYLDAYEDAIRHTSRPEAPWHVVPADNKPFARLMIAETIVEAMEGLKLEYPKIAGAALKELTKVRRALEAEARKRK